MKTKMAATSLKAHQELKDADQLQPKEQEVLDFMSRKGIGALTREQIAQRLGWKESAVCGRCNSLVKKRRLEEIDGGKTASGKSAKMLRVPAQETAQA
jgi:DNA-binding NarL/FixJ family response regulator